MPGAGTGNITLTVHSLERGTGCNYCKSFITRQLERVFLLHLVPARRCKFEAVCLVTELHTLSEPLSGATDNSNSSC